MLDGDGASYFFDQPTKQRQPIILRIGGDLELITRRASVAKLEGVQSDDASCK